MKYCPYIFIFFLLIFSCSNSDNGGSNGTQSSNCSGVIEFTDQALKNLLLNIDCVCTDELMNFPVHDADLNNDGEISVDEANSIQYLRLNGFGITSLEGLECFKELKGLKIDFDGNGAVNNIATIDLTGNTKLQIFHANSIGIENLDVSSNVLLENLECPRNNIESIDLSGCTSLKHLSIFDNQLISMDLVGNTNLRNVYLHGNELEFFEIGEALELENLNLSENKLTSFVLIDKPNLNYINLDDNELVSFETGELLALESLYLNNNNIEVLDLSDFPNLNHLKVDNNNITELDLSSNPNADKVFVSNNNITTINIKNGVQLPYLNDTYFTIAGNPNLNYICMDAIDETNINLYLNDFGYENVVLDTDCD